MGPLETSLQTSPQQLIPRRSVSPHPIIERFRDRFESKGFAFEPGHNIRQVIGPEIVEWVTMARLAGRSAPLDSNPGGQEAGRHRHYTIGIYARRASEGKRFTPIPPFTDHDGKLFTTYMQPPGVNRDYASERRFAPLSDALLEHAGLRQLVDLSFQACPASLFPNEGRDLLKVGLHLISLHAVGARPGISSPNRAHVDGEYVTTIVLLERAGVVGGESLVVGRDYADVHPNEVPFDARVAELTLEDEFDILAVDDRRLAHYVFPVFARRNDHGFRSVLLIDFTPLQAMTSDQRLENE